MIELTILDKLPFPIVAFDIIKSEIAYLNSGCEVAFGLSRKDLVGNPLTRLDSIVRTGSNHPFSSLIEENTVSNDGVGLPVFLPNRKMYTFRYQMQIEDETVLGICAFTDALLSKEEKENISGMVLTPEYLRELRSMLNSILGISQLIQLEPEQTNITQYTNELVSLSEKILAIIQDAGSAPPKAVETVDGVQIPEGIINLTPLLKSLILVHLPKIKEQLLSLRFSAYDDNIYISAGEAEVTAFLHLLLGYIISASKRGDIRVEVFHRMDGHQQSANLKITDCSQGIKQSVYENIQLSFSAEPGSEEELPADLMKVLTEGRRLFSSLGGSFHFQSSYGVGNVFQMLMPVVKFNKPTEKELLASQSPRLPELLIVDDDIIVHQIIKRYLGDRCVAESAMDGRRALLATAKKKYDIIFLDINLGVGLTGLQVAKQLRKISDYEKTPIVAITAYALPGDKERALAAGCSFYQSKPFSRADIQRLFESCLSQVVREQTSSHKTTTIR